MAGNFSKGLSRRLGAGLSWKLGTNLAGQPALSNITNLGDGAYTIYGGPIAIQYGDEIAVGVITTDGNKFQRILGFDIAALSAKTAQTIGTSSQDDDHNNAYVFYRPDQDQLIASRCDHASGTANDIKVHRGTGPDPTDVSSTATATITGTAPTYGYPFINPADLDQLDLINRYGASTELDWRVHRSENFNATPPTFTVYPLFINHYIKAWPAADGSGIWILAGNEPLGTTTGPAATKPVFCQRLAMWFLNWSNDQIYSGGVSEGTLTTPFTQITAQSANQLGYTNSYGAGTSWSRDNLTTSTSAVANRWGATSVSIQKLVDNATNSNHRIRQAVTCVASKRYELSGYFRAGNSELDKILLYGPAGSMASHGTDTSDPRIKVNLTNGTLVEANPGNLDYYEITLFGSSWYRIGFIFTATDTPASPQIYAMLCNAAGNSVYSGAGTGLYCDSIQFGETPYTDRLMPFCQNLTTSKRPSTAVPSVVYDPEENKYVRMMSIKAIDDKVCILFTEFDSHLGADPDIPSYGYVKYCEYDTTTYQTSTPVLVDTLEEGDDDDASTGSHTYTGGDIINRFDVVYSNQKSDVGGTNRIIRARGSNFSNKTVLVETTLATDTVLRPISIPKITYTGGALRLEPGDWIAWMRGDYDGYNPSRGDFDTDVYVAKLG